MPEYRHALVIASVCCIICGDNDVCQVLGKVPGSMLESERQTAGISSKYLLPFTCSGHSVHFALPVVLGCCFYQLVDDRCRVKRADEPLAMDGIELTCETAKTRLLD